ncbi:hypothetical protein H6G97_28145 [Nostoc flagelliforme FACHB-838]|uniref:Uncharacterized protein n=1 Tax=Nostoc flagelliforme FACHB-838 TaxID=2692904 RepID=A0ABR8DXV8_9NOSO|nr:hypothetical protein [Nostoc flagelliforme]MBD2533234.1 hypothetical protein [Nostoc flagelliforme FACHB-838]
MNTTKKGVNNNICEKMTQIQEDLEVLFNNVLEQLGSNIQAEKQAEYTQALPSTKQVIEKFKIRYCPYIYQEK